MKTLAELKALPQWVGYTAKKIPMCPQTGGAAASFVVGWPVVLALFVLFAASGLFVAIGDM